MAEMQSKLDVEQQKCMTAQAHAEARISYLKHQASQRAEELAECRLQVIVPTNIAPLMSEILSFAAALVEMTCHCYGTQAGA